MAVVYMLAFSPQISFFDDVGAMTLQYLDSLFQQDNLQKSQFFKGLAKVLQKMPIVSENGVIFCSIKQTIFKYIILL